MAAFVNRVRRSRPVGRWEPTPNRPNSSDRLVTVHDQKAGSQVANGTYPPCLGWPGRHMACVVEDDEPRANATSGGGTG